MTPFRIYLLLIAFFFAYHPIIYDLRDAVLSNELAHHVPLVLLLAGYLVYSQREQLLKLLSSSLTGDKGIWMLIGLGLNLAGQGGGVYYLSQLSLPVTLYGAVRYLYGRKLARFLLPVFAFLILAFPLPGKVYMSLVFPLKLFVSVVSGFLLAVMGFPVRVQGNVIEVPPLIMGVDDACSGLSSFMAMVTLAFFCGLYFVKAWEKRVLLLAVAIAAVILANILRVTLSAAAAWKWGMWVLEGTFHLLWGTFVFVWAVFILLLVLWMLIKLERGKHFDGT